MATAGREMERCLPDGWLKSYLEYTESQESPRLFHLWAGTSIIAGVLRRNVWIDRGYYTLYPNLYVVLVAPTGRARKSTAANIAIDILLKAVPDVRVIHEKLTPEALIAYLGKWKFNKQNGQPSKSDLAKAISNILGTEKTTEKKEEQKTKLEFKTDANAFIYVPELSVFLGSNNYSSGLVELLTSLYEGKNRWEYRTKTHGEIVLYNVNINMFGASNPEWLAHGFQEDAFGGGFMGRTIHVFQTETKRIAWPRPTAAQKSLGKLLIEDLEKIGTLKGEFEIEKEAYDFFENWYNIYQGDFSGRLAGYYERKPDHVLKLSSILSVSFDNSLVIKKSYIEAAMAMLQNIEETMPEAFAYIGATSEARVQQHLIETLKDNNGVLSNRELLFKLRHLLKNLREYQDVLTTLEVSGIVKQVVMKGQPIVCLAGVYNELMSENKEEDEEDNKIGG